MRTLSLLLFFSMALFKANSQPGSLDPTFGNKGIQTTAFLSNAKDTYVDQGQVALTNANGNIFVLVNVHSSPTSPSSSFSYSIIVKYLPDGRLDSSYGNAGYSEVENGVGF